MNNYERYKVDEKNENQYNKRGLSYWMLRWNVDRTIFPYLKKIKDECILEVGVGYGYYKDAYFNDNNVTGYDVNAFLGKNLGIEIIEGKAGDIRKVERKFNRILSFFMTEYLDFDELTKFIKDSYNYLLADDGGVVATTIIIDSGLGKIYTTLAKMKGIKKYSYSYQELEKILDGMNYTFTPLNSWLGIPFATLVEIKK